MNKIIYAARFAAEAHRGQKRKYTGRPYIEHPGRVAARVMVMPYVVEEVVCAAWMHDVLEDCDGIEIPPTFPNACFELVHELTNPSKGFSHLKRAERKEMDRKHIAGASYWARVLKLLDRIDNVREMAAAPLDFRVLYCKETHLLNEALATNADDVINDLRAELADLIS